MKDVPPPVYVWVLDTDLYSERIVSVSKKGLRERILAVLQASRAFEYNPRPSILGVEDDLHGHLERAFNTRRLLNLSRLGAWALFEFHSKLAPADGRPFVDVATLAALDTAAAYYLRHTVIRESVLLRDVWPGLSEWFVEPGDEPQPEVLPCMHAVVTRYVRRRFSDLFCILKRDFVVHALGPTGAPLKLVGPGEAHGTFLVQALPPVP